MTRFSVVHFYRRNTIWLQDIFRRIDFKDCVFQRCLLEDCLPKAAVLFPAGQSFSLFCKADFSHNWIIRNLQNSIVLDVILSVFMRRLFQHRKSIGIIGSFTVSRKIGDWLSLLIGHFYRFKKRFRRLHWHSSVIDDFNFSHIRYSSNSFFIKSAHIVSLRNNQFPQLINTIFQFVRKYNFSILIGIKCIVLTFISITDSIWKPSAIVWRYCRIRQIRITQISNLKSCPCCVPSYCFTGQLIGLYHLYLILFRLIIYSDWLSLPILRNNNAKGFQHIAFTVSCNFFYHVGSVRKPFYIKLPVLRQGQRMAWISRYPTSVFCYLIGMGIFLIRILRHAFIKYSNIRTVLSPLWFQSNGPFWTGAVVFFSIITISSIRKRVQVIFRLYQLQITSVDIVRISKTAYFITHLLWIFQIDIRRICQYCSFSVFTLISNSILNFPVISPVRKIGNHAMATRAIAARCIFSMSTHRNPSFSRHDRFLTAPVIVRILQNTILIASLLFLKIQFAYVLPRCKHKRIIFCRTKNGQLPAVYQRIVQIQRNLTIQCSISHTGVYTIAIFVPTRIIVLLFSIKGKSR